MRRCLPVLLLACSLQAVAQHASLNGRVTEDDSPVQGVVVRLDGTLYGDTTDANGLFLIRDVAGGTYTLMAELAGYPPLVRSVAVAEGADADAGTIAFRSVDGSSGDAGTVVASSDLADDGGQAYAGTLGASNDAFGAAVAYRWSMARFRPRGYDRQYSMQCMNGMPMKDLVYGLTMHYAWNGLNDMMYNRESAYGLQPAGFVFGGVAGAAAIDSRAASQRRQVQIGYMITEQSYRNFLRASFGTGIGKGGWSFAAAVARQWSEEGYLPGCLFDQTSYFASAEKSFRPGHSLAFTAFGTLAKAGMFSASFAEMNALAGTHYYNPNWGYQGDVKRNARVRRNNLPVGILTHDWKVSDRFALVSSLGMLTGRSLTSALDWTDAPDPRPDYYRNLPSWYYSQGQPAAGDALAQLLQSDEHARQIDWDRLYLRNGLAGDTAVYLVEDRVIAPRIVSVNSTFTWSASGKTTLTGGMAYVHQRSEFYKEVNDLLGAKYHLDINKFARQDFPDDADAYQNDLNNPGRLVARGDRFGYGYSATVVRPSGWLQGQVEMDRIDLFAAAEVAPVSFWREGHYRNGLFPDSSFGRSATLSFVALQAKGGITYKVNGRNHVYAAVLAGTEAPTFYNSFVSPRTRNQVVPGLRTEKIASIEAGYLLRAPRLKIRATVFQTTLADRTTTLSYYSETNDAYINYSLTGIDTRHRGLEASANAQLGHGWSAEAAAGAGEYLYTARPLAAVTQDNLATVVATDDTVFIKNLRIGGFPQCAYSISLKYNDPKYWFVQATLNCFDRTYLDIFPGRRNRDAIDLVDPDSETWESILGQERFGVQASVDLYAGWSWKWSERTDAINGNAYLVFRLGVRNLLDNQDIVTGGYEYPRFGDSVDLDVFKPKYYHASGRIYTAQVFLRFN